MSCEEYDKQKEPLLSVCSLQHSISLCSEKLHSKAFWWSFSLSTQRDAEWNFSGNTPPKSLTLSLNYSLSLFPTPAWCCSILSLSCSQVCRIEWPLSQVFALDLLLPATGYFVLAVAVVVVLCNATCSSWEWMKVLCCAHNISSHIFVFCRHFILPTHTQTHTQSVLFALFLSFRITLFALPWIRRSFAYLRLFSSVFIEQRVHCLIFVNATFVSSLLLSFLSFLFPSAPLLLLF